MAKVVAEGKAPEAQLASLVETFVDFGIEHPAFVDCAQTLMRRPGPELLDEISASALFRLGRGISSCLVQLCSPLDAGVAAGLFEVHDPTLIATYLYSTGFGAPKLARVGPGPQE